MSRLLLPLLYYETYFLEEHLTVCLEVLIDMHGINFSLLTAILTDKLKNDICLLPANAYGFPPIFSFRLTSSTKIYPPTKSCQLSIKRINIRMKE